MIDWDGRETVGRGMRRAVSWSDVLAMCAAMLWPVGLVALVWMVRQ